MRLIFIGPPGSGKGTQAKLLSQRLRLLHFSTGDILRDAIARDTREGKLAKPYMRAGQLVPDDIVNEIVRSRFRAPDHPARFVMDGYPRTLAQAVAFDATLKEQGLELDAVLFLRVADEEIVKRISGRRTCPDPACQATYHTTFKPSQVPNICDACGSPLVQRDDDQAEIVAKRLQIFHERMRELLQHYEDKGLLVEVPGVGDIPAIHERIVQLLGEKGVQVSA